MNRNTNEWVFGSGHVFGVALKEHQKDTTILGGPLRIDTINCSSENVPDASRVARCTEL